MKEDKYPIYLESFEPSYVRIDDEDSVILDGAFDVADLEQIIAIMKGLPNTGLQADLAGFVCKNCGFKATSDFDVCPRCLRQAAKA